MASTREKKVKLFAQKMSRRRRKIVAVVYMFFFIFYFYFYFLIDAKEIGETTQKERARRRKCKPFFLGQSCLYFLPLLISSHWKNSIPMIFYSS
jgi:Na+/H+ antiporter NhaD/arsenite permease-like protein